MDRLFNKFLSKIGFVYTDDPIISQGYFKSYRVTNASETFQAEVVFPHILDYKIITSFFKDIDSFAKLDSGFASELSFIYLEKPSLSLLNKFIKDYTAEYGFENLLSSYYIDLYNSEIVFEYQSELDVNKLMNAVTPLVDLLKRAGINLKVQLGHLPSFNDDLVSSEKVDSEFKQETLANQEQFKLQQQEYLFRKKQEQEFIPCKLKDAATLTLKRVEVTGNIFQLNVKEIKNHTKVMAEIFYEDGTFGMLSNLFENKKFTKEAIMDLKVGDRIKIKGEPSYDDYAKQVVIKIYSIEKVPPLPKRMDNYPGQKRIELHLHTKMSTMDGVGEIPDYINTAVSWGWEALGITDHGAVQGFPKFQDFSKGKIKPLYGCELYVVDANLKTVFNPNNEALKDQTYVVFDLETTGLSARYDRIIEFGAVKVKNGQIVSEVDFFINPDKKLSEVTKNLTGITDEDVASGKPIKRALEDIVTFVKGCTLVSHNAVFDFGFLNEALQNNNMPILTNKVIDTLPLSRILFQDIRSHTLGDVCKKLDVVYDKDEAHRANYDAEVLNSCWQYIEQSLINIKRDFTLNDLSHVIDFLGDSKKQEEIRKNIILQARHPMHVIAYARDKQGLKDLFQIISDSCIKYISGVPRVPKDELQAYREHLLLGSACENGEVFEAAMTRGKSVTEEIMKFYDYIEVQPPANFSHLVAKGSLSSFDDVYKIIRDIVDMAKEINKLVVATSDCHYIEKEDKIFRDVFVFAKGLKGVRHPLNPFSRDKQKYYDNPDQFLRTTEEMIEEFSFLNNEELVKEIVITNTHKVADMISSDVHPIHDYLAAPIIDNCDVLLKNKVMETAHKLYGDPLPKIVADRLEAEMSGISANHFEVIYWIASKLVTQANADGYLVGSRGSVGSSLVATMAGITEVNPLQPHYRCPNPNCKHLEWIDNTTYPDIRSGFDLPDKECPICHTKMVHDGHNIPFATFIGFHAEKTPDIDLNFPPDYQPHAHDLTRILLTEESGNQVFKAGTTETVAEKNAIGYAKGYFEALEKHPELNIVASNVPRSELTRLALKCEGVKRTTGQHPGGIIVIPRGKDVTDFTPIQYPSDDTSKSWYTSHFDYNQMHDTILKLDLLGHVDPQALKMMSENSHKDLYSIPFNDPEVLSLFTSTKALKLGHNYLNVNVGTMGMPEFGTRFSMSMLEETKPTTFADLLIISGLSHGTDVYAGNQQILIKEGITNLRGVIGCRDDIMMTLHDTYGIPFDDAFQIMEITRHGKFNPTVKKTYEKFVKYKQEMIDYKVPDYFINSCIKIKYLFPKAHAAAYVMMALRVGWFKVHDPLSFYATYFSVRLDQYEISTMVKGLQACLNRLNELKEKKANFKVTPTEEDLILCLQMSIEMLDRGFKFEKIDVNKSEATRFIINWKNKSLIPPFSSLAGIGESAAVSVIEARNKAPFKSIDDFIKRTSISTTKVQELKALGAFNDLPESDEITLF